MWPAHLPFSSYNHVIVTWIFIWLSRYYFALVECDSSATADHIYKENDGVEFEHSSNPLDLRFIPDDMEFKQPPKDVATEVFNIYIYDVSCIIIME